MISHGRRYVLTLVFASACFAAAKEPPPRAIKAPQNLAKVNKSGDLEMQYTVHVAVEEVRVEIRDGRPIKFSVTRLTPEARIRAIAKDQFEVFDRTGRKLAPMELAQRLKDHVRVHVQHDGKAPTEQELQQLKMNEYFVVIKKPESDSPQKTKE